MKESIVLESDEPQDFLNAKSFSEKVIMLSKEFDGSYFHSAVSLSKEMDLEEEVVASLLTDPLKALIESECFEKNLIKKNNTIW